MEMATEPSDMQLLEGLAKRLDKSLFRTLSDGDKHQQEEAAELHQTAGGSAAGADGSFEELLETTWSWSDLTARPCLASAASERHFSPGSPEETSLHKMLFLPAAALCCLCSALAAMATQLVQEDLTLTRRRDESVSFICGGTDQCVGSYVTWYQKKDSETFRAILYISKGGTTEKPFNHPQQNDFSAERDHNSCTLKINKVTDSHSASYYCGCITFDSGEYLFGSGTKLYVTEQEVKPPVVSVYPAATSAHQEGRASLLCLASDMFPPLVQISWKRQKKDGDVEDLSSAEVEQLELRESRRSASILLVDQDPVITYSYSCHVKHEYAEVGAQTQPELPAPAASCPPERPDLAALQQAGLSFQSQSRVKLLCLLYTVLIVKSLVYCCGLSLLMMFTNKEPST